MRRDRPPTHPVSVKEITRLYANHFLELHGNSFNQLVFPRSAVALARG
jgi:hypothetical protein